MELRHIERGTRLRIMVMTQDQYEDLLESQAEAQLESLVDSLVEGQADEQTEIDEDAEAEALTEVLSEVIAGVMASNNDVPTETNEVFDGVYYDIHDFISEISFVVKSPELHKSYLHLDRNASLEISFTGGPSVYTFIGRAVEKLSNDLVVIEQISDIETLNRRKYQRDEIRVEVRVYSISEEEIHSRPRYNRPGVKPLLTDTSYDISAGGMCIITKTSLNVAHDPYYLIEFSISERDWFLLPAKLVRRSNYTRSRMGKYEYGFQFIFDDSSDEMNRLTRAILTKKLSFIR